MKVPAMSILILGGEGMMGHKAFQVLSSRFETHATFLDDRGPWRSFPVYAGETRTHGGVNALEFETVEEVVRSLKPAWIINCIGIIKQLEEAHDPILSISLNALFPHRLARLCASTGSRMIHLSTDCVFTGKKGNYTEADASDAEDLYGRTKFLGEVAGPGCLTIRTSIFGRDFLKQSALLEWFLSNRGGKVRGYKNSVYTGFPTQVMAGIMGDVIERYPDLSGVYQVASRPISKLDLLVKIRDAMKLDVEITPWDDPRCDRSLRADRFVAATGYRIPGWDEMVRQLAEDPTPYDEWRRRHATV
jgi:dTDP-4-dehydrorhamnose reductase